MRLALAVSRPRDGPDVYSCAADWMEYTHEYFKKTVFSTKCRSWYKKGLEGASTRPLSFFPFLRSRR